MQPICCFLLLFFFLLCPEKPAAAPQMPARYMLEADQPAGPLHAPAGYYRPPAGTQPSTFACPALLPPYTGSLVFPSKYRGSDRARDRINPEASAEYERLAGILRNFEKTVSSLADRYVEADGDPRVLECFLEQVSSWAAADALLNTECNEIGMASRKWLLAATASAWLQVSLAVPEEMTGHPRQVRAVEAWFTRLAETVREDYSGRDLNHINNHDYWAGWAVMAASVVLDRRDLFVWAWNRLRIAVNEQVTDQGYLPNELRRRTRALLYHNYALQPLTMILVFGEANGIHLQAGETAGYRRLVDRVVKGIGNPAIFAEVTSSPQEVDSLRTPYSLAWLLPYGTVFHADPAVHRLVDEYGKMVSTRLGGNLTRLYAPFQR